MYYTHEKVDVEILDQKFWFIVEGYNYLYVDVEGEFSDVS